MIQTGPHRRRIVELRPEEAHRDGLRRGEQVGYERAGQHQAVQQDRDLVLGAADDAAVLRAGWLSGSGIGTQLAARSRR